MGRGLDLLALEECPCWSGEKRHRSQVPDQASKGAWNETAAIMDLMRHGYLVYRNVSATGVPDLVAYKAPSTLIRVEVRAPDRKMPGQFRPKPEKEEHIDLYAVVCWGGNVRYVLPSGPL